MHNARRNLVGLALLAGLALTLPANAQSTTPTPTDSTPTTTSPAPSTAPADSNSTTDDAKPVHLQKTQVDFVDSREGYWVNRGFNDMMFGTNGGVINEARIERDKDADQQSLRKIYKPPTLVQVTVKNPKTANPTIGINGKVIEVK